MAMQSTEGNVQGTEVLSFISVIAGSCFISATFHALSWFVSAIFNALSWFVPVIFNALSWFISAIFRVLSWFISTIFNALSWLVSKIFNALSWLVYGIRNGLWFLIINSAQRVSLYSNSMLRPMTIVRLLGAAMILATFFIINSSVYLSSLDTSARWIWRCCILVQVSLMLPFPRKVKPKDILQLFQNRWCQSIPYDALKAAGSVICYFVFEWLGSTIQIHNDSHLMYASITFFLFLVIVDLLYDVEEAIKICDGYIFAVYGLMLEQEIVLQKFIHTTCFLCCFLKTYMRSNRDLVLAQIENPEPEDIPLLPVTTQPTASTSIQNDESSSQLLEISDVVRRDQKVLYRSKSFTRVRSNTDEVGYN